MKRTAGDMPRDPLIRELRDITRFRSEVSDMRAEGIRVSDEQIEDVMDLMAEECEFDHVTFEGSGRGSRFMDVCFRGCDFSSSEFDEASFCRCRFENCRLLGTSMIRASFRDVTFRDTVLDYANFSGSSFTGVRFEHCRLPEAAVTMCTLKQTVFRECDLSRCEFTDTKLADTDLSDSEIGGILVKPADLRGVTVNRDQAVVFAMLLGINVKD